MRISSPGAAILPLLLLLALPFVARADAMAEAGRAIIATHRQAVVTLLVTTQTRITGGGELDTNEHTTETVGIVIDGSGLIVTSLAGLQYAQETDKPEGGAGPDTVQITNVINAIAVVLEGGKEFAARLVAHDAALDLAFIRPVKTLDKPLPAIDPTRAATPQLLDDIFLLERLSPATGRTLAIMPTRIIAAVEKPRRCYLMSPAGVNLGGPVFAADGMLVGIRALLTAPARAEQYGPEAVDIIRPAADIVEAARRLK